VIIILKQGNYLFRMHLECFKAIGLFIIQASFYLHGYYYYFALKKRENGILKLVKETISLVIRDKPSKGQTMIYKTMHRQLMNYKGFQIHTPLFICLIA
jgi:hypothetical protein